MYFGFQYWKSLCAQFMDIISSFSFVDRDNFKLPNYGIEKLRKAG